MINLISEKYFELLLNTVCFTDYIHNSFNLNEDYSKPLQKYILLEEFAFHFLTDYSMLDVFYNKYYYYCQFIKLYQIKYGENSDFDQQRFKIIENAGNAINDIDWNIVEQIENII
jgi:hypothetical protein